MKKFSHKINEEWNLGFSKPNNPEFIKVSDQLIKKYCMNLYDGELLTLHSSEKDQYDFEYYKVSSIKKIDRYKYEVSIQTYDLSSNPLKELKYYLEV